MFTPGEDFFQDEDRSDVGVCMMVDQHIKAIFHLGNVKLLGISRGGLALG